MPTTPRQALFDALHASFPNAAEIRNGTGDFTLVDGEAFGNDPDWILGAVRRALRVC